MIQEIFHQQLTEEARWKGASNFSNQINLSQLYSKLIHLELAREPLVRAISNRYLLATQKLSGEVTLVKCFFCRTVDRINWIDWQLYYRANPTKEVHLKSFTEKPLRQAPKCSRIKPNRAEFSKSVHFISEILFGLFGHLPLSSDWFIQREAQVRLAISIVQLIRQVLPFGQQEKIQFFATNPTNSVL